MDIKPKPLPYLDETDKKHQEIAASIRSTWEIIKAKLTATNPSIDEQGALKVIFENFRSLEKIWNQNPFNRQLCKPPSLMPTTRPDLGAFCDICIQVLQDMNYVEVSVTVKGWTAAAALGTCLQNRKEHIVKTMLRHGFKLNFRTAKREYRFRIQGPICPRPMQLYCWKTDDYTDQTRLSQRIQNLIAWSGCRMNLQAACRRVILRSLQHQSADIDIDGLPVSVPFKQVLKYEDRDYFGERVPSLWPRRKTPASGRRLTPETMS